MTKFWTDYPIQQLGDIPYQEAPIREVKILEYDRNKYVTVLVEGYEIEIKAGYIYLEPGRNGKVPQVHFPRRHIGLFVDG